ncbi:S-layer homology domain-containing protein [Aquibacillus salsiterrae]|uniref:S-layer homology domain-containing protein n=1 Tax=Aquibacillus salsiterrae TaxID=2950439 RepID=A0A9X3WCQ1_9BACI|nr:S-layer homology domain-containing protein [Aquibacillus salsiterrae]MDC3415971.1 S-layer homology domain-containing protein [Aquibacillus salsiterrae]
MLKKSSLIIVLLCGLMLATPVSAASSESSNLSIEEIKEQITTIALKYDIPPEIMKAIAFVETGYSQFKSDGSPNVSDDGGIGIMQVTPTDIDLPVDEEKLKTDMVYNIEVAAQVLNRKWELSYLPEINDRDRSVLENWYFAVMAYNGLSKTNDPNLNPTTAYQERVYNRMEGSSLIYWSEDLFEFPTFDIRYEDGSSKMKFAEGKHYTTNTITRSQQMYKLGDIVFIDERDGSVSLRPDLVQGQVTTKLWPYTPLEIVATPKESSSLENDFVYYKVKGVSADGYVASAYLNKGSETMMFEDSNDDKRAAALAFMALNGYATGYPNGNFGSFDRIKREHVAVILDNILDLDMPSDYQMEADDVNVVNPYFNQLAKVEYNGLLGAGGMLRPKELLTRAQMAQVMSTSFAAYYEKPTTNHTFKDQQAIWNPEAVNLIYYNDVTVADPFQPNEDITRSQFAIFLYRTMVNY